MSISIVLLSLVPIVDALTELKVGYYIVGSFAGLTYGTYNNTGNIDIVADLQMEHVQPLVKVLEGKYYIDADMVQDAIQRCSEFNVIHYETMMKVDVFIQKTRLFDQQVANRAGMKSLDEASSDHLFCIESPEDVILSKLEWYRAGGEISERQWLDLLGVLKVQGTTLDFAYLRRWARILKVDDLLEKAFEDAGLEI